VQDLGDLEAAGLDSLGHGLGCPSWVRFLDGRAAADRAGLPRIEKTAASGDLRNPFVDPMMPRAWLSRAWPGSRRCAAAAPGRAATSLLGWRIEKHPALSYQL
jgi:hypothetical protein